MRSAVVVRMVPERGFGFLRDDLTGKEYFFHKTTVLPSRHDFDRLRPNVCVIFEIDEDADKPRAAVVQLVHND